MTTQIWHREIPYNTMDGIKLIGIVERYDLELLQEVKDAKARPGEKDDEAIPSTWVDVLLFALVCPLSAVFWYWIIAEAVR